MLQIKADRKAEWSKFEDGYGYEGLKQPELKKPRYDEFGHRDNNHSAVEFELPESGAGEELEAVSFGQWVIKWMAKTAEEEKRTGVPQLNTLCPVPPVPGQTFVGDPTEEVDQEEKVKDSKGKVTKRMRKVRLFKQRDKYNAAMMARRVVESSVAGIAHLIEAWYERLLDKAKYTGVLLDLVSCMCADLYGMKHEPTRRVCLWAVALDMAAIGMESPDIERAVWNLLDSVARWSVAVGGVSEKDIYR
jgi:hypothetical protein